MRAVVFDLFHTLIDTEHVRPEGFRATTAIAELLALSEPAFTAWWDAAMLERETTVIDLVDLVQRYLGGRSLTATEREQLDGVFGLVPDAALARPDPEMLSLVADLSGCVDVAVLSNCHEREVRTWNASPFAVHVNVFVGSCFAGAMKPDPSSYRAVLSALDVAASEAVFVGNGGSDELDGASAIGFGAVIHNNVFDRANGLVSETQQRRRAGQAHHSVATIDELRAAIFDRL